jgi:hypothetical protein
MLMRWCAVATEIQNVQIGWGDVCRQIAIPIYMIFPRLFTCPTMLTPRTLAASGHVALDR